MQDWSEFKKDGFAPGFQTFDGWNPQTVASELVQYELSEKDWLYWTILCLKHVKNFMFKTHEEETSKQFWLLNLGGILWVADTDMETSMSMVGGDD